MKPKGIITVLSVCSLLFFISSQGAVIFSLEYTCPSLLDTIPDDLLPSSFPTLMSPITGFSEVVQFPISSTSWPSSSEPIFWSAGGHSWMNYDFGNKCSLQDNMDWPVCIIFYGNASLEIVQSLPIFDSQPLRPNSMNLPYFDGNNNIGAWAENRGKKQACIINWDFCTLHLRFYAPPIGYFEGTDGYGHYVIATAHFDLDPYKDRHCGYSEWAECYALAQLKSYGYLVKHNWASIGNSEGNGMEPICIDRKGNIISDIILGKRQHCWLSDGYVSLVYIQ